MEFLTRRFLLLDLDGTVIDSQEGIFNGVRYAMDRMGLPRPEASVLRKFIGPALDATFREVIGLSAEQAGEAVSFYREYYSTAGIEQCAAYPGIEELLSLLREEKRWIALATKKPQAFAEKILTGLGLDGYFHAICGSSFEEKHNDKGHILQQAMDQLGVLDRAQAVMIGDSWYDCEGARQAGVDCVGVLYGFGEEASMREHGAAAIVRDMEGLRRLLTGC